MKKTIYVLIMILVCACLVSACSNQGTINQDENSESSINSTEVEKMPVHLEWDEDEVIQYVEENAEEGSEYSVYEMGGVAANLQWFGMDKYFGFYDETGKGKIEYIKIDVEKEDSEQVLDILKEWYGAPHKGEYDTTHIWQSDGVVIEYRWYKGGVVEVTYWTVPDYEEAYDVKL